MNNIEELKEKVKKGTISYFSLSQEELLGVREALEKEISEDRKELENITKKIIEEKKKIQNNNL